MARWFSVAALAVLPLVALVASGAAVLDAMTLERTLCEDALARRRNAEDGLNRIAGENGAVVVLARDLAREHRQRADADVQRLCHTFKWW
jgi:hypothetical protein